MPEGFFLFGLEGVSREHGVMLEPADRAQGGGEVECIVNSVLEPLGYI